MRFALLALALAFALLAATVRADYANFENADDDSIEDQAESFDDVDEADEADEADDADEADEDVEDEEKEECSPEPKTETKTLGGKEIRQETENISIRGRCVRVLKGGSPEAYTTAGSCMRCKSSGGRWSCVGSPLARSTKCAMVTGPDCNLHSVDRSDHTKAC
ncbi:hypothetical protein BOX15_Mlig016941g3 [Macrostomum lignano]|uniref:Uncharacterized protein n=1 Tax=Macrostomum lignano TaxID=282301 RepID=A0A267FYG5_9PLAT|nr:hypothetical protein BOX15_Mlig016941g3 [Macrostomum lignano]